MISHTLSLSAVVFLLHETHLFAASRNTTDLAPSSTMSSSNTFSNQFSLSLEATNLIPRTAVSGTVEDIIRYARDTQVGIGTLPGSLKLSVYRIPAQISLQKKT
jgi:hypothetical protein